MLAVVSGRACSAFLRRDEETWVRLRYETPDVEEPCSQFELEYALQGCADVMTLEVPSEAEARTALFDAVDLTEGVDLTVWLLDGTLSDETRMSVAEELDELLAYAEIREAWEGVFYARPLAEGTDVAGALRIALAVSAAHVTRCLETLAAAQPAIREVRQAADEATLKIGSATDDARRREGFCVREGVYRDFAREWLEAKGDVSKARFRWATSSAFRAEGIVDWVTWLNALGAGLNAWGAGLGGAPKVRTQASRGTEIDIDEESASGARGKGFRGRRSVDRGALKQKVDSQKQAALAALDRREVARAEQIVEQLIEFQLGFSGTSNAAVFAAMSLCDLAQRAYKLGFLKQQYDWAHRAVQLVPDDGWAWAQLGHALRLVCDYDEALEAYRRSIYFGNHEVGETGRAETLKGMGRLDEALLAYDEVVARHPKNVVAKIGRAETLKGMGRPVDALAAYDEAVARHPESVVAKTGRAETLNGLERLDDALAAYDEVVARHPENVVAKNGRAETLKRLGRLDEALAAYDEAVARHPESVVAKTGRAETLKSMGRLADALAAYDEVVARHSENVVAKTGRAETLKVLGRLDEALAAYEEVVARHPESVVAKNGREETLKGMGLLDSALAAYDEVVERHPEDVVAKNGRAEMHKGMGRLADALAAFDEVVEPGRWALLMLMGRTEEVRRECPVARNGESLDDWINQHIRAMAALKLDMWEEARRLLDDGVRNCVHASQLRYYRTALAMLALKERNTALAAECLAEVSGEPSSPQVQLLRVHLAVEEGDFSGAEASMAKVPELPGVPFRDVREEIARRYVDRNSAAHDNEWLFRREVDMLLAA